MLWPLQVGLLLLDSQLFIHLTHPADKLQLALQMLMKLYALVRHLPTATPLGETRSPCSCSSAYRSSFTGSCLPLQANGQCCEDNPDALTHHEILLPGHLLLKFLKEQLETGLDAFKQQASSVAPLPTCAESMCCVSDAGSKHAAPTTMRCARPPADRERPREGPSGGQLARRAVHQKGS